MDSPASVQRGDDDAMSLEKTTTRFVKSKIAAAQEEEEESLLSAHYSYSRFAHVIVLLRQQ